MIITVGKYAEALYKVTVGKSETETRHIVKDFAEIIIANGDAGKLNDISKAFSASWNQHEGMIDAEVKSVEKLDEAVLKNLNKYIAQITQAKKVILAENIDKSVLGGVIINYCDKVIDGSLRTKLQQLRDNMVK